MKHKTNTTRISENKRNVYGVFNLTWNGCIKGFGLIFTIIGISFYLTDNIFYAPTLFCGLILLWHRGNRKK